MGMYNNVLYTQEYRSWQLQSLLVLLGDLEFHFGRYLVSDPCVPVCVCKDPALTLSS